ncbi:MAG: ketoacyl-synthetase C-terminal extension domain-containing protein, partial [Desulfobulbus sp.]|nr:ketoacyl-synthetase C-terminal extension domain-containing protein [Desulfobulbus sp.]
MAPEALDYLEAHGTGTAVGDPVEARAIGEALGACRSATAPLPIGSIKGNLGHLEAASGVAGLVKAINCLQHRKIPASVGMETVNPNIDIKSLNIDIVTEPRALKAKGQLTVGVNSFGFGGANAHVILQTPGEQAPSLACDVQPSIPLILSTRDQNALPGLAAAYAALVRSQPEEYPTIAYNAAFRRDRLPHGTVFWGAESAQVGSLLEKAANGENDPAIYTGTALDNPSRAAFIYSGNGSQWAGMGSRLLEDALFLETLAEIDSFFKPLSGFSLTEELAGKNGEDRYQFTEIAQPALFA